MTNAQVAARLLREAAGIFNTIRQQNSELKRLDEYAELFEIVADQVEKSPQGEFGSPSA